MAAPKNFVTGFNHNIKHKGQVFHVQTEDSGVENATISTHLFVGGTILATLRCSYADWLVVPDLAQRVRARMEEQHKEMLRNLVNGKYDDAGLAMPSYQPGQIEVQGTAAAVGAATPAAAAPAPRAVPAAAARAARPDAAPAAVPPAAPAAAAASAAAPGKPQPVALGMPLPAQPVTPGPTSPVAPGVPPATRQPARTPPVPTGWTSGAALRNTTPGPSARRTPGPAAAQRPPASPAPARPFGEDLITDRSLDQVILAWLAGEDREG